MKESRERLPKQPQSPTHCSICGERLRGKYFRIDNRRVACNRCNNEKPAT